MDYLNNGLMLYRQFLENIRDSIQNYDLDSLEKKDYLSILSRVNEIEDMTYIDVILKNAGLDLSFISDTNFLYTPVELQNKLSEVIEEEIFEGDEELEEAYNEYLNNFISKEEEILSKIDDIVSKSKTISFENLPKSSSSVLSLDEIIEKNKNTLSSLFGCMNAFSESQKNLENDKEEQDEIETEEEEFEELEDDLEVLEEIEEQVKEEIEETEEDLIGVEELDGVEDIVEIDEEIEENVIEDSIKVEEVEEKQPKRKKLNTDFLSNDFVEDEEEIEEIEDTDSNEDNFEEDLDDIDVKGKEFSLYLDSDEEDIEDNEDIEDIEDNEDTEEEPLITDEDLEEDYISSLEERDLDEEVSKMYSLYEEEETDPQEGTLFREASEYFLNGGKKVKRNKSSEKENLKELYKKKEKLVDVEGVNDFDDALAKFLLALGDGFMNLPNTTSGLINKMRNGSKKMYGNMRVGDDENEETDD